MTNSECAVTVICGTGWQRNETPSEQGHSLHRGILWIHESLLKPRKKLITYLHVLDGGK